MNIGNDLQRAYWDGYDDAKREVARDIFAELDLVMERIRVYETVAPMSAYYQLVGCIESLKEKYKD